MQGNNSLFENIYQGFFGGVVLVHIFKRLGVLL